ncbi:vacuolar ATPase assembly integral membrane protein vma21, partial [Linderina pennispora]
HKQEQPKAEVAATVPDSDSDDDGDDGLAVGTPRVPSHVVRKLVVFSLLLLIMPIMVYFMTLKYVFAGKTAASAIAAVVAANLVLAAFVYAAWVEELEDREQDSKAKRQ